MILHDSEKHPYNINARSILQFIHDVKFTPWIHLRLIEISRRVMFLFSLIVTS